MISDVIFKINILLNNLLAILFLLITHFSRLNVSKLAIVVFKLEWSNIGKYWYLLFYHGTLYRNYRYLIQTDFMLQDFFYTVITKKIITLLLSDLILFA